MGATCSEYSASSATDVISSPDGALPKIPMPLEPDGPGLKTAAGAPEKIGPAARCGNTSTFEGSLDPRVYVLYILTQNPKSADFNLC